MPDGLGFRLFGIAHFCCGWAEIVLAVLAIADLPPLETRRAVHRLLCGLTWAALLLEICKDGSCCTGAVFVPAICRWICARAVHFVEFAAVKTSSAAAEPVYSLSLPGSVWHCCFPTVLAAPVELFQPAASCSTGCWCWCRRSLPQLETAAVLLHLLAAACVPGFAE